MDIFVKGFFGDNQAEGCVIESRIQARKFRMVITIKELRSITEQQGMNVKYKRKPFTMDVCNTIKRSNLYPLSFIDVISMKVSPSMLDLIKQSKQLEEDLHGIIRRNMANPDSLWHYDNELVSVVMGYKREKELCK